MNSLSTASIIAGIIVISGCINNDDTKSICEWTHTQVVGHRAMTELNNKLPSIYLGIKCPRGIPSKDYFLTNQKTKIALDRDHSTENILVLKADIIKIDSLLGRQIRDSTAYRKTLEQELGKWILMEDEKEVPKSKAYVTKFGYIETRID
jgi:hypothetical protein